MNRSLLRLGVSAGLAAGLSWALADLPIPATKEDFFQPGSQPEGYEQFLTSPNCGTCHGSYDETVQILKPWQGSMMAHAARDPLFYACLAVAEQDASFVGDICIRCHSPRAWLSGRSDPTDGSAINPGDRDSVNCHVCHRAVDPIYKEGVSPVEDELILDNLATPPDEVGGGRYVMDPFDRRRGPRGVEPPHSFLHSPFHKDSALCGTCHDVSNPVYLRQEDGTYVLDDLDAPHPTQRQADQFPLERTYSEWLHSEFARGGVDMGGRFGGNEPVVGTCQDCHMPAVTSRACDFGEPETYEDMASHELVGGNTWIPDVLINLYPNEVDADALMAGKERARDMLRKAATLEVAQVGDRLRVRVINETGHKLPSGYVEGRRMWINVECYDEFNQLLRTFGAYDWDTADLTAEDTKVYEAKLGVDEAVSKLTGIPLGESFHFAVNNVYLKDNRVPPRGFSNEAFRSVQAAPVAKGYSDGQYWDDTDYLLPVGTAEAVVTVYYQTVSKDYILFLLNENRTNTAGKVLHEQWLATGKAPPVDMAVRTVPVDWFDHGDYDADADVDLDDYREFWGCLNGPGIAVPPECYPGDLNGDGDVDLDDFSRLQTRFGWFE